MPAAGLLCKRLRPDPEGRFSQPSYCERIIESDSCKVAKVVAG